MRAVESVWYRNFLLNLDKIKNRYDKAITESTTGKKLNKFSDSPADVSYVLNLRNKIEQTNQFMENIDTGLSFLSSSESAINSVLNQMYSVISLAEQGASETNGSDERIIIADRIEEIRDSVLNNANTEVLGRFLFSGSQTNELPFVKDPNEAVPDTVLYNGNSDTVEIQADFSVRIQINIPGSEVFGVGPFAPPGSSDVFQRLADLRDALLADDTAAIQNSIGNMHELTDQINNALGKIGNKSRHLHDTKGLLMDFKNAITEKMSSLEDADLAKAISDLTKEEVGLQATLQIGARINSVSLINYIR